MIYSQNQLEILLFLIFHFNSIGRWEKHFDQNQQIYGLLLMCRSGTEDIVLNIYSTSIYLLNMKSRAVRCFAWTIIHYKQWESKIIKIVKLFGVRLWNNGSKLINLNLWTWILSNKNCNRNEIRELNIHCVFFLVGNKCVRWCHNIRVSDVHCLFYNFLKTAKK